jgi:hypothetical protein
MHLAIELIGLAVYVAVHIPLALIYVLGSTLPGIPAIPYWAVLAAGYLTLLGLVLFQPAFLSGMQRRQVVDLWLTTSLPAVIVAVLLVLLKWPVRYAGWSGHGFGAEGGEANALFLPWLHAGLLLVGGRIWRRARPVEALGHQSQQ